MKLFISRGATRDWLPFMEHIKHSYKCVLILIKNNTTFNLFLIPFYLLCTALFTCP